MRIGIVILLCIAGESFLVYALFHFVRESMRNFRPAHAGSAFVTEQSREVVPLQFAISVSTLTWSAGAWASYAYDELTAQRVVFARGR